VWRRGRRPRSAIIAEVGSAPHVLHKEHDRSRCRRDVAGKARENEMFRLVYLTIALTLCAITPSPDMRAADQNVAFVNDAKDTAVK
jgi:hypothetical protein